MRKIAVVALFVYVVAYLLPLGVRPLQIPDELRYAEQAREMVVSNDWIVPRLDGVRYFEKPILATWLNASSVVVLGESAFAVRLPSVIAVGLTALLLFWLVRRVTGDDPTAGLTALIYITFLQVFAVGTFVVFDSVLTLFVTGAMVTFYLAHREPDRARRWQGLGAFGLMCGLAFLTKGFLAFVVSGGVIAAFLAWERRWKAMFTQPWLPAIVALLVALPWSLAIAMREPDFWHYFGWVEHVQRFISSPVSQHPEPPWYFVQIIIGGSLPWAVFAPHAIVDLVRSHANRSLIRLASCWVLIPFLFFSASSGKLGTYIQPCYPPLAILLALGLVEGQRRAKPRSFRAGIVLMTVLTGTGLLWVVISRSIRPGFEWGSGANLEWAVLAATMLLWTSMLMGSLRSRDESTRLLIFAIGPTVLFVAAPVVVALGITSPRRTPGVAIEKYSEWIDDDTLIVAEADLVPTIGWTYGRSDLFMLGPAGELSYGFAYDDASHRLIDSESLPGFLEDRRRTSSVVLIVWEETSLDVDLPPPARDEAYRGVRVVLYRPDRLSESSE